MPPPDATLGDDKEYLCNGNVVYYAPNGGEKRGVERTYKVSPGKAEKLKARQAAILEELGLTTS